MSPELRRSLMATLCGSGLLTVSLLLLTEKIGHDLMKGLGGKEKRGLSSSFFYFSTQSLIYEEK